MPRSLCYSIFSSFNYLFYGLSDSGFILKALGQNLRFSVKNEGTNPLIYIIKTKEYKSLLRKIILKLRVFFTNKKIR